MPHDPFANLDLLTWPNPALPFPPPPIQFTFPDLHMTLVCNEFNLHEGNEQPEACRGEGGRILRLHYFI